MDDGMDNWTVNRIGKNSHEIAFSPISNGWEGYILATADRHWDNQLSNWSLQKEHLEKAIERNAPAIDVGDWFCAMQGRGDPRSNYGALRNAHKRDDYLDALPETAAEWFAPYANNLAVIGRGNHETKVLKHYHTDLTARLAKELREKSGLPWPYAGGFAGYIKLRFTIQSTVKQTITIKYTHGGGGGGIVSRGTLKAPRRATIYPAADIVLSGHIHEGWWLPIRRELVSQQGRQYTAVQHHVSLPTYKDEWTFGDGGFHEEREGNPRPIGAVWLRLVCRNGRVVAMPEVDLLD